MLEWKRENHFLTRVLGVSTCIPEICVRIPIDWCNIMVCVNDAPRIIATDLNGDDLQNIRYDFVFHVHYYQQRLRIQTYFTLSMQWYRLSIIKLGSIKQQDS